MVAEVRGSGISASAERLGALSRVQHEKRKIATIPQNQQLYSIFRDFADADVWKMDIGHIDTS